MNGAKKVKDKKDTKTKQQKGYRMRKDAEKSSRRSENGNTLIVCLFVWFLDVLVNY